MFVKVFFRMNIEDLEFLKYRMNSVSESSDVEGFYE